MDAAAVKHKCTVSALSICSGSYTIVNCQLSIYKLSLQVNFDSKYVETVGVREGWIVSVWMLGMRKAASGDNKKLWVTGK